VERVLPQAAREAGQVHHTIARLGLEELPAQAAPRAKGAQSARVVDKAAMLVLADGPAEQAVKPQETAELREPEVLPAREARSEPVAPVAVPKGPAVPQAQAAEPEREACSARAARTPMAEWLAEVARPQPVARLELAARSGKVARPQLAA
jgi:hypothetical protein